VFWPLVKGLGLALGANLAKKSADAVVQLTDVPGGTQNQEVLGIVCQTPFIITCTVTELLYRVNRTLQSPASQVLLLLHVSCRVQVVPAVASEANQHTASTIQSPQTTTRLKFIRFLLRIRMANPVEVRLLAN
jgi:hypothetical protein